MLIIQSGIAQSAWRMLDLKPLLLIPVVVAVASSTLPTGLGVIELVAAVLWPFVNFAAPEASLETGLVLLALFMFFAVISGRRLVQAQYTDQFGQRG